MTYDYLLDSHNCMQKSYFIFLFITTCLFGCLPDIKVIETQKKFFDLSQLIDNQVSILEEKKPLVIKSIITKQDTIQKKTSIKNWKTELKPFKECDINVPAFKEFYRVEKKKNKTTYTATTNRLKVQKIILQKNQNNIEKIEIEYNQKNNIYHTKRSYQLTFVANKLKTYHIKGFQKIKYKKPNHFQIIVSIP